MMFLLTVDDKDYITKEKYNKLLGTVNVKVVNTLQEAKRYLLRSVNGEIPYSTLVINTLIIANSYETVFLEEISNFYQGAIIIRVHDAELGKQLLDKGLITDFYLDGEYEMENFKQVLELAKIRKRCNNRLVEMNKKLEVIKLIEKKLVDK